MFVLFLTWELDWLYFLWLLPYNSDLGILASSLLKNLSRLGIS